MEIDINIPAKGHKVFEVKSRILNLGVTCFGVLLDIGVFSFFPRRQTEV